MKNSLVPSVKEVYGSMGVFLGENKVPLFVVEYVMAISSVGENAANSNAKPSSNGNET